MNDVKYVKNELSNITYVVNVILFFLSFATLNMSVINQKLSIYELARLNTNITDIIFFNNEGFQILFRFVFILYGIPICSLILLGYKDIDKFYNIIIKILNFVSFYAIFLVLVVKFGTAASVTLELGFFVFIMNYIFMIGLTEFNKKVEVPITNVKLTREEEIQGIKGIENHIKIPETNTRNTPSKSKTYSENLENKRQAAAVNAYGTLKVVRPKAFSGSLSTYTVILDGKENGNLKNNTSFTSIIKTGKHTLSFKVLGIYSRSLEFIVGPKEFLEIECISKSGLFDIKIVDRKIM